MSDFARSKKFYVKTLKPIGYKLEHNYPGEAAGFCEGDSTSFWIVRKSKKVQPIHVAFRTTNKKAVEKFHKEGVAAGGKDNGKPGFRLEYGADYFAAFLLDPDGNNVEACYFGERAPVKK